MKNNNKQLRLKPKYRNLLHDLECWVLVFLAQLLACAFWWVAIVGVDI